MTKKFTNRDYINTLSNDKFVDIILQKESEFHCKNFNPKLDIFDITDGTRIDFENWLEDEYKEGIDK